MLGAAAAITREAAPGDTTTSVPYSQSVPVSATPKPESISLFPPQHECIPYYGYRLCTNLVKTPGGTVFKCPAVAIVQCAVIAHVSLRHNNVT